jgi:hypothetical protein
VPSSSGVSIDFARVGTSRSSWPGHVVVRLADFGSCVEAVEAQERAGAALHRNEGDELARPVDSSIPNFRMSDRRSDQMGKRGDPRRPST